MKETKTIQVYPSDSIVNATIGEYESFGWEVVGNQRCQEFEGTTYGFDGSSTKHYSTFNKITFTREKDSAWYEEIKGLEKEFHELGDTVKSYKNRKPVLRELKLDGIAAFSIGFWLYLMLLLPGIIFSVVRACKKTKYKKQYQNALARYEQEYPAKIKELEGKRSELRSRAENLIAGKA